jgi:hypothetical protein
LVTDNYIAWWCADHEWEFRPVGSDAVHDALVSQFTEDDIGKLRSILRTEAAKELGLDLPPVLGL